MNKITVMLDAATEARLRAAAEMFDRPVEQIAELAVAEAGHAFFAEMPDRDPAHGMGVLHPSLLPREAL
jgi:predicted transcriptional regulator